MNKGDAVFTKEGEGVIERVLPKGFLVWIRRGKRYRSLVFMDTKQIFHVIK